MIQFRTSLFSLIFIFSVVILNAQNLPLVHFDFGDVQFKENLTNKEYLEDVLDFELGNSVFYCWVQFDNIPEKESKSALTKLGVRFLEYVPTQCYLLEVPGDIVVSQLRNEGARSIQPMMQTSKIDTRIIDQDIPAHALTQDGDIQLHLVTMPDINPKNYEAELKNLDAYHLKYMENDRHVFLSVNRASALLIAELHWVRYLEIIPPPGEPESVEGMSIQRANLLNNALTGGYRFDGSGVKILVRDDGDVGPHIDFHGRLWNDPANTGNGSHGDGVAGVFAASGNLDPTVVAGGSGSDIYVIDYDASFLDRTMSLHQDSGVVITNSSYSNGCNAGYTLSTVTVDEQVFENPSLAHIFSAGNSNGNDCGYGAGDQWGNITGGHKQGKNVITTANLDREGGLVQSSSRGPAHDGRIKPDLAAHGAGQISTAAGNQYRSFGGTSAAAPTLASSMSQLYQAYFDLNGIMPPSALIKACAMNSAQDLGNPGPDYKYGWGSMHALRAYEILANNQYFTDAIEQGGSHSISIDVPDDVGQLRIMLYWADPPASLNSAIALVNDLDLTVEDPSTNTLLPYLLNHNPNAQTLDEPAGRGADHLNNVEQVAFLTPEAGTYIVNIAGQAIPDGPQEYYVLYSFIPKGVELTYPIGNEKLVQNVTERIHWDAFGNSEPFTLEFSTDVSSPWTTIATNIPADVRELDWTPPMVVSGDCLIRITRGAESDVSDETFSIHTVPTNIGFQSITNDSAFIHWTSAPGAESYNIYQLGTNRMEVIGQSVDTFFKFGNLEDRSIYWFSVSANTLTAEGQRALAVYYYNALYSQCAGCIDFLALPYLEDFEENDLGYHCNFSRDSIDWTTLDTNTPSINTGPQGASGGHGYAYLEASPPNNPFKIGSLGGPCLDLSTCQNAYMQFDYHMFGEFMGELNLIVSIDAGESWSTPIWAKTGDQGNQWHREIVDLTDYCGGGFLYQFVGTTGLEFTSDIAIDQIYIDEGMVCFTPNNLRVDTIGQTDVLIAWDESSNGGPYDLELVNTEAGMTFSGVPSVVDVSETTHHFSGLTPFNEYEVYLRAQCGVDSSTWLGPLVIYPGCNYYPGNSFEIPLEVMSFPYVDTNSLEQICSQNFWGGIAPELVYRVQIGNHDSLIINLCNDVTNFDTYLYLLDSTGMLITENDDAEMVCVDKGFSRTFSILEASVDPNTTYFVVVSAYDGNDQFAAGEYVISIDISCDPILNTTNIDTSLVAGSIFLENIVNSDTIITVIYQNSEMECDSIVNYNIEVYTGVNDISVGNIRISPNPFNQYFVIESLTKLQSLQVSNAQGKEIIRVDNIVDNKINVSMEEFPAGIYFIQIEQEGRLYSSRLIKS